MSGAVLQPPAIPSLRRLVPWALAGAVLGHCALVFFYPATTTTTGAGGGGRVVGTLSIALGGVPSPAPAEKVSEPQTEPEPVPEIKTVPDRKAATIRRPVEPVRKKPTKTQPLKPKPAAPASTQRSAAPPAAAQSAQRAQEATPTLGRGAAAQTPGSGGAVNPAARDHDLYLAMIREMIEKHRNYPAAARRAGHTGLVQVKLTIAADGSLSDVHVSSGSGHFALDRAARRMVERAAPFPSPPSPSFGVTLPLVFSLG